MKKYQYLLIPAIFLVAFVVFTILVKTVDVDYLALGNYKIGFKSFNYETQSKILDMARQSPMKKLSDVLLYVSIGSCLIYVVIGIYQLIKTKSLFKVNYRLYMLALTYVSIAVIYFIFEILKINYSPDLTNGLKASYPSSHVFIGATLICVNIYAAMEMLNMNEENKWLRTVGYIAGLVICVALIVSRTLSAKHWATDIIASVILTGFIVSLFIALYNKFFVTKKEDVEEVE